MRSIGLALLLLMAMHLCVVRSSSANNAPALAWQRTVDLPSLATTVPVAVPLDSHFFEFTRRGWPDVRLLDRRDAPVGFVVGAAHRKTTKSVRRYWTAAQSGAKVSADTGLSVELKSPDEEPLPAGLRVLTPLRDFENQVIIESSADGVNWAPAAQPTLIFDYSRYLDARNDIVLLPGNGHRRFRLTIAQVTSEQESQLLELHRHLQGTTEESRDARSLIARRPFRIDRVECFGDKLVTEATGAETTAYVAQKFKVDEDVKTHATTITFSTHGEPITSITLDIAGENFSRQARVEAQTSTRNGAAHWQSLGGGSVTRFAVGDIRREAVSLAIPETAARDYRVVIDNRDSPALTIQGAKLTGPLYELMFLASPGDRLTLAYGSDTLAAGDFDTAALAAVLHEQHAVTPATLGAPRAGGPPIALPVPTWQPWNDPRVWIPAMVLAVAGLGWSLYRASQRISVADEPS